MKTMVDTQFYVSQHFYYTLPTPNKYCTLEGFTSEETKKKQPKYIAVILKSFLADHYLPVRSEVHERNLFLQCSQRPVGPGKVLSNSLCVLFALSSLALLHNTGPSSP